MKNKLIRNIDSQGRISIPWILMEYTSLKKGDVIAFVTVEEEMVSFVPYEKAIDMPIIHKAKITQKNRIIIPKELRDGIEKVEIFFYNGFITIK